jgi:hypothetical protein
MAAVVELLFAMFGSAASAVTDAVFVTLLPAFNFNMSVIVAAGR